MGSLSFAPVSSSVNPGFWNKLSDLKLNVYKLDESCRNIWGCYTIPNTSGLTFMEVDSTSFNKKFNESLQNIPFHGKLYNKNSIDEFKASNKTLLLCSEGKHLYEKIRNNSILKDPSQLNFFVLLTFADLKKYHYYYWFAFPVPKELDLKIVSLNPVTTSFSQKKIEIIYNEYKKLDYRQRSHFLLINRKSSIEIHSLEAKIGYINLETINELYFVFFNISSYSNELGSQMRNYVSFILYHCPFLQNQDVKFLALNLSRKGINVGFWKSTVFELKLPELKLDNFQTWVGWEPNERNKMGPRLANMTASLDPLSIAENAVDLNLKLMKWNILPHINLEKIKKSNYLLLGSGTLGCSVARTLLGWGVRNITFIDNSTVSFSNPVRQSLFTYDDSVKHKPKSYAAADNLKQIFPGVNSKGIQLNINMPGHSIGESMKEQTFQDVNELTQLIKDHDIIFILMDSRESRWLPTLLSSYYKKVVINAALGFDSYLVMRHGIRVENSLSLNHNNLDRLKTINGCELGCYFCNDVTAPGNSLKGRTLDQQCTVTRPGVSQIAGALAAELAISVLQHEKGIEAPASYTRSEHTEILNESVLGIVPHSIRGFLHSFEHILPATEKYVNCVACSKMILDEYKEHGSDFLFKVFNNSKHLEDIALLTEMFNETHFNEHRKLCVFRGVVDYSEYTGRPRKEVIHRPEEVAQIRVSVYFIEFRNVCVNWMEDLRQSLSETDRICELHFAQESIKNSQSFIIGEKAIKFPYFERRLQSEIVLMMVRNYVRKSDRAKSYTKDILQRAVDDIKTGTLTLKSASRLYNIPLTTLKDHVKGRRGQKSSTFGRKPDIPAEIETEIANALCTMEKWGFGFSRNEVLDLVAEFIVASGIKTQFKNGRPGKDWFINFRKRHRLSIKKPQSVEIARKKILDPFIIDDYFKLLKTVLTDLDLFDKPGQIFNLDESSFCSDPSKTKVVGKIGKPSTRTVSGPGRENTTVLMACSASGTKLPPLIIFKGKSVWNEWVAKEGSGYPGTAYAATKKGWMETEVFNNYLKKTFIPNIGDERPVLLIYDGHSTHITIEVVQMAIKEQITILKLPPHSSHLLQPLDISVFRSLKSSWDAKLVKWQREHPGMKIPKKMFSELIGQVWLESSSEILRSGFRKAGIFPFDDKVISKENYDPASLERWEKMTEDNQLVMTNLEQEALLESPNQMALDPIPETSMNVETVIPSLSTKPLTTKSTEPISFESILLKTFKRTNEQQTIKKSKRKVCDGAEVITSKEVLQRLKEKNETKKTGKKKKCPAELESTSDEEDEFITESEEEQDFNSLEEFENEDQGSVTKQVKDVIVNDWVLVKFCSKKTVKYFVGLVTLISNDGITVKFTRKSSFLKKKSIFIFPAVEDCSVVFENDIITVLPMPNIGRRGEISFNICFDNYNMQ